MRQQFDYGRESECALQWGADSGTHAPRKYGESDGETGPGAEETQATNDANSGMHGRNRLVYGDK
jgi:hypothetical protein